MTPKASNETERSAVPIHWSPEQALAVLEFLHAMR